MLFQGIDISNDEVLRHKPTDDLKTYRCQDAPKSRCSIGTEPILHESADFDTSKITFSPSMSYAEKLLLQMNKREELLSKVDEKREAEFNLTGGQCDSVESKLIN